MDRFTWGAVVAVVVLCGVAIGSVLVGRQTTAPPDMGTPEGVVTAYVVAIQEKRADDAWSLLASPRAAQSGPRFESEDETLDGFRRTVNNTYGGNNRRMRILEVKRESETARVDVDVTTVSAEPFWFGIPSSSRTVTFNLKRDGATWKITSAPSVWELR